MILDALKVHGDGTDRLIQVVVKQQARIIGQLGQLPPAGVPVVHDDEPTVPKETALASTSRDQ